MHCLNDSVITFFSLKNIPGNHFFLPTVLQFYVMIRKHLALDGMLADGR